VSVALHETAVREHAFVLAHRRDEPRVVGIDDAEGREQEVRGVGVHPVKGLREVAEFGVVGAGQHALALGARSTCPSRRASRAPREAATQHNTFENV
jgi:hypothetical protein